MPENPPTLYILINHWTMFNLVNENGEAWSQEQRIRAVAEAGFDAFCCPADVPNLKAMLKKHGLRFGGAFDISKIEQIAPRISAAMAVDNGPINVQVADHNTSLADATKFTIALMEEAERQGAEAHLEVHRDTCTETPEKTNAIIDAFKQAKGYYPRINYDFSHPSVVKHLHPGNFAERLIDNVPLFQQSTLWHMRPFNGHHCQVPVTDGQGNFSREYNDLRPFIKTALKHWLAGPRPRNELWVCPELGPKIGYGLSCFPDSWPDAIVLGNDIRTLWAEALAE